MKKVVDYLANYAIIYLRVECNKINYINLRKEDCRIIYISL